MTTRQEQGRFHIKVVYRQIRNHIQPTVTVTVWWHKSVVDDRASILNRYLYAISTKRSIKPRCKQVCTLNTGCPTKHDS